MADIFYFSSPPTPLPSRSHADSKKKLRPCKRRRHTGMDTQTQHACVARLEEPTFCPSNVSSVLPLSLYNDIASLSLRSPERPTRTSSHSDHGSVPEAEGLNSIPSTLQEYIRRPASTSSDLISRNRIWPTPSPNTTSRLRRPRSTTPDLETTSLREPRTFSLYDPFIPPWFQALHPDFNGFIEDEGLAVDDPQRSYDFAEFMKKWSQIQCMYPDLDIRMPPVVKTEGFQGEVTQDDAREMGIDMQGLDWSRSGTHREAALDARRRFHPSQRRKYVPLGSKTRKLYEKEVHYGFKAFLRKHTSKISHFQLRNVLTASNRNDIFYSAGNQVMQTSLSYPSLRNCVMDLTRPRNSSCGFSVTCLSAAGTQTDNMLFTGGFNGEYAMLDINSESCTEPTMGFVTHDYDGIVTHVQSYSNRRSGLLQAAFCSNDWKVRVMDARTARFTNSFTYETAINCSALSPDGRLRVLVGDTQETLITDAEKGNIIVTLNEHSDHGFACSWSHDGRYTATGAQDGKVIVWDARNWSEPLAKMSCVMSSARSLHFTEDGALVVAEEDDVVSIYSHRGFDQRQDLRFFGPIAGLTVLDGGSEIIVANADDTVGGLLRWRRTPQGLNQGTYGERANKNTVNFSYPQSCLVRQRSELIERVLI